MSDFNTFKEQASLEKLKTELQSHTAQIDQTTQLKIEKSAKASNMALNFMILKIG